VHAFGDPVRSGYSIRTSEPRITLSRTPLRASLGGLVGLEYNASGEQRSWSVAMTEQIVAAGEPAGQRVGVLRGTRAADGGIT
jgi:hypothetical protein